ncbi:hypothetical protein BD410DRAFT_842444 [Rickenella mellea]|uniref:Uncharacterized protein n=1 Tax=Rickenella mellea TaxID=50990 RepID=A0A4Y7PUE0_9AGAM|nr:hypothetical protein BD410DRAFT_842444 [Rickenella mellea]
MTSGKNVIATTQLPTGGLARNGRWFVERRDIGEWDDSRLFPTSRQPISQLETPPGTTPLEHGFAHNAQFVVRHGTPVARRVPECPSVELFVVDSTSPPYPLRPFTPHTTNPISQFQDQRLTIIADTFVFPAVANEPADCALTGRKSVDVDAAKHAAASHVVDRRIVLVVCNRERKKSKEER